MKLKLATAGLMIFAAAALSSADFATRDTGRSQGAWAYTPGGPVIGMYSDTTSSVPIAALAFHRSNSDSKPAEFAIAVDKDGARFQVVDAAGKIHMIPATALLALEAKCPCKCDCGPKPVE